jgi:hypothetical protein
MSSPHTPQQNHLLAALPAADYARLAPDLELIPMPLGWAVYESGGQLGYLYFPTTSIVSLLYVMESGASAERTGRKNRPAPGAGSGPHQARHAVSVAIGAQGRA